MNLTSRYPIAIDLSDGAEMCALQLTARRGSAVVRAAARRPARVAERGLASDDDVCAFVRDILRSPAFRGRSVALLPPGETVRSYPVRVEVDKEEGLEAALVRHAATALDLPGEEWFLDYASVVEERSNGKGVYNVLLVAARKERVEHYCDLVKKAGGDVDVMGSAAAALVRAHGLTPTGPHPVLLCNVGRSRTALVVATRDSILAHRNADWGTALLTRRLIDNLGLAGKERDAEFLLRKHGLSHAAPLDHGGGAADTVSETTGQLLAPLADELIHELHNLVGYVRSAVPDIVLDTLFMYGSGAGVNGLAGYLAGELNLKAQVVNNPLQGAGDSHDQAGPVVGDGAANALAIGLALGRVRWL